jgi:acetolactate synthase-1/2/3 large subunit
MTSQRRRTLTSVTVADQVPELLGSLGITAVFGIPGGAIAPVWDALARSDIDLLHFRHEAGAAFAATEAYFATGAPVAVCVTSGPGITNAITGLHAARSDGAKIMLISGATPKHLRGRHPFQETGPDVLGPELFAAGPLFHHAALIDGDLADVARPLAEGFGGIGGFVAHLSITRDAQSRAATRLLPSRPLAVPGRRLPPPDMALVKEIAHLVSTERMMLWVGFGARHAAGEIVELAERTGTQVVCSPRAKGIFPEQHPAFAGVTGLAGGAVVDRPDRVLVLGSRLGEMTSFWSPKLVPARGFLHVDIDDEVPGSAYPEVPTVSVRADIGELVRGVLAELPATAARVTPDRSVLPEPPARAGRVRPRMLMAAVQRVVVDGSRAIVLAEAGNSMGHMVAGVVGAAHAVGGKSVAIVGDGAMLMNCEISTAVQYRIPAVWIVLNDSAYGMVRQGMTAEGYRAEGVGMPRTDFAMLARAMGAEGARVATEAELDDALAAAMAADGPFVLDVLVDDTCQAPIGRRVASLASQTQTVE